MAGFFQAVALDLDGTLTSGGAVNADVLAAVDEASQRGTAMILASGRIHAELVADLPGLTEHFDKIVLENGAVIGADARFRPLCPPVEPQLAQALDRRGVRFRRGECILACAVADAPAVVEEINLLGLDCHPMHNREQLMVLPAGVSKGTGLRAALDELGISPHNTAAVGDAENDLALLELAEIGAAVSNAVPSVRQHADLRLEAADGEGVARFLRGPVVAGRDVIHPARRQVRIGQTTQGAPVTVPGAQASILVRGPTGAGKSYLAGLLVERWRAAGYTVLVVDPEGDHLALGRLPGTIVIDASTSPDTGHLLQILRHQGLSIVLDLSNLGPDDARPYLQGVAVTIASARAVYGLPHWIVVDEAHGFIGEQGSLADLFRPLDRGHCLVSYQPERLWTPTMTTADLVLTALGRSTGAGARPERATATHHPAGGPETTFVLDDRATRHVRHLHKYVTSPLPVDRCFVFRDTSGRVLSTAASVREFVSALESVDVVSVQHHALRGDFSRWILGAIQDRELGGAVSTIENELIARFTTDAERTRRRIVDEVTDRYLSGAGQAAPEPGEE